jgi:SAM-dependent methyltransferase
VPSAVPTPLASIAGRLQCPTCSGRLAPASGALICPHGHTFDVARQGYVTLQAPARRLHAGDDQPMVSARAEILQAGHFAPLTAALAEKALEVEGADSPVVLDVGAGTAHHLAGVIGAVARAQGIALDASSAASRRAARAHPRIAAVRGDVWRHIPLGDATVDLALSVFAPRNAPEFARVLRQGGTLVVVTPAPEHLCELATLHRMRIDPSKPERLDRQFTSALRLTSVRQITWTLRLTRDEAHGVMRMGPAARHLRPDLHRRLALLQEPALVTAAVEMRTFHRPALSARALRHLSARTRVPR